MGLDTHRVSDKVSKIRSRHLVPLDRAFPGTRVGARKPDPRNNASLRRHREDILELAEHFLARHRGLRRLALSESAAEALLTYDWPGNVRELQRAIERALALSAGDVLGVTDLPPELTCDYTEVLYPSVARAESMRAWGSRYARLVLERCDRNKRRTCEVLGISYHTLQSYLRYLAPAPRPGC